MAIHEFNFNQGQENLQGFVPEPKEMPQQLGKVVDVGSPAVHDSRDEAHYDLREFGDIDDRIDVNFVEEVREKLLPGFKQFDRHLKNYFSGIRVPTGKGLEAYRIAPVRIAGGDKSTLVYANRNLVAGRSELPAIAITRTGEEFDPNRFTPAKHEVARITKNINKRVELKYRPVPYNINYTIDIWAEHKVDADYIQYSIASRFNPLATIYIEDDDITMPLEMHFGGSTNNTDLETDADTKAEIRYQISLKVEGWLALPTKIVPTVLTRTVSIKEGLVVGRDLLVGGETYEVIRDRPLYQKE